MEYLQEYVKYQLLLYKIYNSKHDVDKSVSILETAKDAQTQLVKRAGWELSEMLQEEKKKLTESVQVYMCV